MKPHIKKVNGEWVVANRADCCVFQLASSLSWCELKNWLNRYGPFIKAAEEICLNKTTEEELYIWDQRQFDRAAH